MKQPRNEAIKLSVIIPAYNEKRNFQAGCLSRVSDYLGGRKYAWEVILVDDGSNDGSSAFLKEFCQGNSRYRYFKIFHQGKLGAIMAGVKKAKGKIVLFTDFDQSTPIKEVEKVAAEFNKGAVIVVGNRWAKQSIRKKDSWLSLIRSRVFSRLVSLIIGWDIKDSQCGFKAFERETGKQLFRQLKVHQAKKINKPYMGAFDVELLFLARKKGLAVKSIPISWTRVKSDKLTWEEPFLMLWSLLKVKIFDWLGKYKN